MFNSMAKEGTFCTNIMKKDVNKEPVMIKEDDEDFESSTKWRIYDHIYVEGDPKIRDHCHITGKYRATAHRDCNINTELNHKMCVIFRNL